MIDITKTEYAITEADRRDIHNGLCELYNALNQLESTLHPDAMQRLRKGYDLIEKGFLDVAEQEEEISEAKSELYDQIRDELNARGVWSLDVVTDFSASFRKRYGIDEGRTVTVEYKSNEVKLTKTKSTWKDLYKAADKLIRQSGDSHHIFIESFHATSNKVQPRLMLVTGS